MEYLNVCEERLKKQTFLKKDILEKGYDPQEFQEFLEKKKRDGGTNIDIWEYQELKDVYLLFKTRFFNDLLLACKRIPFNQKQAF